MHFASRPRRHLISILHRIGPAVFSQYRTNSEDFIRKTAQSINEQKATVIVEHLAYSPADDAYDIDIFTREKPKEDFSKAFKSNRHVYNYVFTDSETERKFVRELDSGTEVEVYAKLPKAFLLPTPVGNYNPDWAIAFMQGSVKHIYFIAETKGRLSSNQVKYDVVDSYAKLMELLRNSLGGPFDSAYYAAGFSSIGASL